MTANASQFVHTRDGHEIYVEDHGNGRPLVLLHGALGTITSCFSGLLPALTASRRVIAVEFQGHGHTPDVADRSLTVERLATDVIDVVDALDIDRCDIVGYSLGGAVAIQAAMDHPQRLQRLVYAGGAAFSYDGLHSQILAGLDSVDVNQLDDSPWHDAYVAVARDPAAWSSLVAKVTAMDRARPGWTADEIRSVTTPCLLIVGDSDIVRLDHVVAMFELLGGGVPGDLVGVPSSQLAVLPATTHVTMLERVDQLARLILDFLR